MSSKMGEFNTPSVSQFFQKENGGLKLLFQNRRKATIFCWAHERSAAKQRFFLFPLDGFETYTNCVNFLPASVKAGSIYPLLN